MEKRKLSISALLGALLVLGTCSVGFDEVLDKNVRGITDPVPEPPVVEDLATAIGITYAEDAGYGLSGSGYDFGYAASAVSAAFTLKNAMTFPRVISTATFTPDSFDADGVADFAVSTALPLTIAPGETGTLNVTFTPSAGHLSSAVLKLTDADGRTFSTHLQGSGLQEPKNLDGLVLWLDASKIRASDVATADGESRVETWRDRSGKGMDAERIYPDTSARPRYISSVERLGNRPALYFGGSQFLTSGNLTAPVYNTNVGTTIFIVFQLTETNATLISGRSPAGFNYNDTNYFYNRFYFLHSTTAPYPIPYAFTYYAYPSTTPTTTPARTNYYYNVARQFGAAWSSTSAADQLQWDLSGTKSYAWSVRQDFSLVDVANIFQWINGTQQIVSGYYSAANVGITPAVIAPASAYNQKGQYFTVGGSYFSVTTGTPVLTGGFYGNIAEVFLFNKPLSDPDMAKMHAYIKQKYGFSY